MNTQKMQEVFADKAFVKSLLELDTAAEVQAALKEKGVDVTEEELLSIREMCLKAEDGELSEDALEQVSGGFSWGDLMQVIGPLELDGGRW